MKKTSIELVKILQDAGHTAYWAGGCVRDMLMGKNPQDYDIATSAKPDEIESLISKTIPIGKKFGVILAISNNHHFEVATFRSDSGYSDGRRPDAIEFADAYLDAQRRDFTINGLFYDPITKELFDYIDGQKDLKHELLRFIGNPDDRIDEDNLRIIRAVRFKSTFDFQYHPTTYQALLKKSHLIRNISGERLKDEMNKIMFSNNNVQAIEDMEDLGILKEILPEIQAMKAVPQPRIYHQEGDVFTHSLMALKSLPIDASLSLRWATLLHDAGKVTSFDVKERIRFNQHERESEKISRIILKRLNFPAKYINRIVWLVGHHMLLLPLDEMSPARRKHWYFKEYFPELMQLFKADIKGTQPSDMSLYKKVERAYRYALKKMPKKPKKLLSGDEVMSNLNIQPGKEVGAILEELSHKQLEGKIKDKKQALDWLKNQKKSK